MKQLSAEQQDRLEKDGVIILRNLIDSETISMWKQAVVESYKAIGGKDGISVWMPDMLTPLISDICQNSAISEAINDSLNGNAEFLSVKPVYKSAEVSFASAWHQDYAYWGGSHKLSAWIALDKATKENGCLKFLLGKHKAVMEHSRTDGSSSFDHRLGDDQIDENLSIDAEMEAGDIAIFHDLAPHASFPNNSGKDRWSLIATYRDQTVPDSSTVWN